jgi:hypothetical protein
MLSGMMRNFHIGDIRSPVLSYEHSERRNLQKCGAKPRQVKRPAQPVLRFRASLNSDRLGRRSKV